MATFEAYRRRREAIYGVSRRAGQQGHGVKDLLQVLIVLMVLAGVLAVRVWFTMPNS
ncbi:hypothetical protein LJR009_005542 [Bosea sp. LjRoot9]|uniref:hypothetical protein n=1 Tax=Bosea sp. LjRoot9 TaxID=3342341 RepID=UPI003ED102A0